MNPPGGGRTKPAPSLELTPAGDATGDGPAADGPEPGPSGAPTDADQRRLRIAFVSQVFDCVGPDALNSVGLTTHQLARHLSGANDVAVFANGGVPGNRFDQPTRGLPGVEYHLVPSSRRDKFFFRAWPRLSPAIGRVRGGLTPPLSSAALVSRDYIRQVADDIKGRTFDVIHVQHVAHHVPVLRRVAPDAKIVLHLHAEWFAQMRPAALAQQLATVDAVVGCSAYVAERAAQMVPSLEGRVAFVQNAADTDEAAADLPGQRPMDEPFVLYVGAISPHRGVHDLIKAFGALAPRYPDLRLVLVGATGKYLLEECFPFDDPELLGAARQLYKGDYEDLLERSLPADIRRRVVRPGFLSQQQLRAYYRSAELFALPTLYNEGLPLPIVETMSYGCPIVSTDFGAVREAIVDGETGFIVKRGDWSAMAERMERLLSDGGLRHRFARSSRSRATELFDWAVAAEKMEGIYRDLLS